MDAARISSSSPLSLKDAARALGVGVNDIHEVVLVSEGGDVFNFNVILRRGVKWLGKRGEQVAFPVNKSDLQRIRDA